MLAQQTSAAFGKDNVVYTGYSLGGDLATQAAITTGAPAVTFNAKGTDPATAIIAGKVSPQDYKIASSTCEDTWSKAKFSTDFRTIRPSPAILAAASSWHARAGRGTGPLCT